MIIISMEFPNEIPMTKSICFVDTVGWIAILNVDDELHDKSDKIYKTMMLSGYSFVTSTAVLNEVANALSKSSRRNSIVEFYKRLQKSPIVEIVFVDMKLWESGWYLYENRHDKDWSLTDCISFIIMDERKIQDSLTNDKHFEQAGYNAIIRKNKH